MKIKLNLTQNIFMLAQWVIKQSMVLGNGNVIREQNQERRLVEESFKLPCN